MRLSKGSDDREDGRLAPGILLQSAIVAVGDSVTVWRALSPIQFNELLGDGADRKVEFAALVASELDGCRVAGVIPNPYDTSVSAT